MTALTGATELLRKGLRTNNVARVADALQISFGQLDSFATGADPRNVWGADYPDMLDRLAEYFYLGHRRYDVTTDALSSVHNAKPLPMHVGMSSEAVQQAINSSYRPVKGVRTLAEVKK